MASAAEEDKRAYRVMYHIAKKGDQPRMAWIAINGTDMKGKERDDVPLERWVDEKTNEVYYLVQHRYPKAFAAGEIASASEDAKKQKQNTSIMNMSMSAGMVHYASLVKDQSSEIVVRLYVCPSVEPMVCLVAESSCATLKGVGLTSEKLIPTMGTAINRHLKRQEGPDTLLLCMGPF